MRIIRFICDEGHTHFGEQQSDGRARILHSRPSPQGIEFQTTGEGIPIRRLLAPIEPPNILCAGRNYAGTGASADEELELFMKPTTAIAHPGEAILMPRCADGEDPQLACEGELAVVIRRLAQRVSEVAALDYVLGYTLAGDVTARRWQTKEGPPQWMRGKGFDTFCPLGPALLTPDQFQDLNELELTTRINGEIRRQGKVKDMIRNVPRLIAQISAHITLLPGTVVLTGAPALVASSSEVPLKGDDRIDISCEPIGTLSSSIVSQ